MAANPAAVRSPQRAAPAPQGTEAVRASGAPAASANAGNPAMPQMPPNLTPQQAAAWKAQQMRLMQQRAAQAQAKQTGGAPAAAPVPAGGPNDPANKCHLIARTPVFDAHRTVQMYRLRFSSGSKFITDRVLPQHVGAIINDFFLQRPIINFVGTKSKALIMMPVNPALTALVKKGIASRLVLQIPSYQEPSVQVVDFMSKIKRFGIRFAVDLMDVMKRGWLKGILHIEYVMINMGDQGAWQLAVFQKLKVKAPWLKVIAYGDRKSVV